MENIKTDLHTLSVELVYFLTIKRINIMKTHWTQPEVTEMRFGFEVTMYVANR